MGLCGTSSIVVKNKDAKSKSSNTTYNSNNEKSLSITRSEDIKIPKNKEGFIFKAMLGEKEYPIFIKKNEEIQIYIIPGDSSLWGFLPNEELTDFKGYENYKYNNLNIGSLLIRISSSKQYINITHHKNVFKATESGSLMISANLDPSNYPSYTPSGSMNINIVGGDYVDDFKIDELTNYQNLQYENSKASKSLSEENINISRYINKARSNIKKYIHDYIIDTNVNDININEENCLPLCKINDKLYTIAEEHCQNLCKNGTSGNIAPDDILAKKIMEEQKISPKDWAECIIFGINNPISIVNFLIIDKYSKKKKYRNILLNEKYSQIGISLNKHISYGFCCIIIFSTSKIVHQ